MPEATEIMFKHKEVVGALLKQHGIHEGFWMLSINFGIGAGNVGQTEDQSDLNPAAIIPILNIGIKRVDQLNNLSADAAEVNPE